MRSHPGDNELQFEPESAKDVNLEIDSPTTIDRLKEMTWTDRICSLTHNRGLLFGPAVFVTDILYYVDVGFENNTYQVAYRGFLFLQPIAPSPQHLPAPLTLNCSLITSPTLPISPIPLIAPQARPSSVSQCQLRQEQLIVALCR
jgi:hypothetical protein